MSRQSWRLAAVVGLAVVLDWAAARHLRVWGVAPDLLLLATIVIGLARGRGIGMGVGFALGLLQGVTAGRWLSAYACAQVLAGYGGGELRRLVFVDNPYVRLGAVAALTAVAQVVFLALSGAAGWGEGAGMAAGRALYHAALSPLAFAALGPAEGKEAKP